MYSVSCSVASIVFMKLRKEEIQKILETAIAEKVFPGAVVGIVSSTGEKEFICAGRYTYSVDSPVVLQNTIYDCASLTKPIPVNILALLLIQEGILDVDAPVSRYLPEYTGALRDHILIRHLLTYSVTFDYRELQDKIKTAALSGEELRNAILSSQITFPSGSKVQYSNSPTIILGWIIEKVTGRTIADLAKERLFNPLAMQDSSLCLSDPLRTPPTENMPYRGGDVAGVVHDETAYVLSRDGITPGCAGLFATAEDILKVLFGLLPQDGSGILNEETLRAVETNQIENQQNDCMGLGFELCNTRWMGEYVSSKTFGKTGFTGTAFIVDRAQGIAAVFLSNRTYPIRSTTAEPIQAVRREIFDTILGSI